MCVTLDYRQIREREIQSVLSAAAADVEDISDFIGNGGISSIDWTGIPLNKVTFLSIFSHFVPSAGKFALLGEIRRRKGIRKFLFRVFFFTLVVLYLCVKPQLPALRTNPVVGWVCFLTILCPFLHFKWQMAAVSSWNHSMELFVWTEIIQLLKEPASYLTK